MPTGPHDGPLLVVDDHALFSESVAIALTLEGYDVRRPSLHRDLDLVGIAVAIRPRVALVDLDLGEFGDGPELIRPLTTRGTNVVVVTASADRAQWGGCLQLGARTVLCKNAPFETMTSTVRRLFVGLPVLGRHASSRSWRSSRFPRSSPPSASLTGWAGTAAEPGPDAACACARIGR